VLPSDLQTFSYHLGNMHNLDSKIREDTTLQIELTVKQALNRNSAKSENWIVELCLDPETNASRAQDFLKICTLVEQTIRNTLSFECVVYIDSN
jgi:hypothetical protein